MKKETPSAALRRREKKAARDLSVPAREPLLAAADDERLVGERRVAEAGHRRLQGDAVGDGRRVVEEVVRARDDA